MSHSPAMFAHHDPLAVVDHQTSLDQKLAAIHETLRMHLPFVTRIAAALYDEKTDLVKTFLHSSSDAQPLVYYQSKLGAASSLLEIVRQRRPRVINDLAIFRDGRQQHTQRISKEGYAASYTMPMYVRGALFGFLFFNSHEPNRFTEDALRMLDPYGHLIALTIINDLNAIKTMLATVHAARDMSHLRDDETGSHQDRMSRYARLIAQKIAPKYGFTDEYIENIFIFSVLHDIGKIGLPDNILLKPGKLTEAEFEQMKTHPVKGRQLIDQLLSGFDLDSLPHVEILRNIAELHHEAVDGSGYPHGFKQDEIAIEARITAVADVFDALTSRRPYKEPWSNEQAFELLEQLSGIKFDPDCVAALTQSREEIEIIQRQFKEDALG